MGMVADSGQGGKKLWTLRLCFLRLYWVMIHDMLQVVGISRWIVVQVDV